jgi:hypothetical protein
LVYAEELEDMNKQLKYWRQVERRKRACLLSTGTSKRMSQVALVIFVICGYKADSAAEYIQQLVGKSCSALADRKT